MKLQEVAFRSIDDFLAYLPEDEWRLVEFLRKIVFTCLPNCTEKLAYNVPYYRVHQNICFIWPASIKWGKQVTYQGVRFGFAQGYRLSDEINYLNRGNRKQVYWKDFTSITEIDVDLLKAYIYEAALVDEQLKKHRTKPKSNNLV